MEENKEMHVKIILEIKIIVSTKGEVYRLPKNNGKYFLPSLLQTNQNFIHYVMTW